ncbi:SRPBCC family protein [Hahella sp. NBU794]|uniref:SRPBCC family protein n=1 Tax=Hahella sp. NBU794 TaxID=3422590 RepID=UPI003D6DEA68
MMRSFEYTINAGVERVFRELVLLENADKWLKAKKLVAVEFKGSKERPDGYLMRYLVGDNALATTTIDFELYDYLKEVRMIEKSTKLDDGNEAAADRSMPIKHMHQRLQFAACESGTKVTHQVYYETKGLLSWLICFFLIHPAVKKEVFSVNRKISAFLSSGV